MALEGEYLEFITEKLELESLTSDELTARIALSKIYHSERQREILHLPTIGMENIGKLVRKEISIDDIV